MRLAAAIVLLAGSVLPAGRANMYDLFERDKLFPLGCATGCAPWAEVAAARRANNATWVGKIVDVDASFAAGRVPADAANLCAMPGMANPGEVGNESWWDHIQAAYGGSFCFCEDASKAKDAADRYVAGYCRSDHGVPEQINLQIASASTVVVGFVTFERSFPANPPTAEFGKEGGSSVETLSGVSHWYVEKAGPCDFPNTNPCTAEGRNYTMSFVKFQSLEPGQRYSYRVKSGASDGQWSDTFTFRSAQADGGHTRLAVYGDMGVYGYNNMANLKQDCEDGTIDALVHMGDHVYFWEGADNKRGDAYMNAFQPVLSVCPWIPLLGNHEYNDADDSWRFVNQTFGEAYAQERDGSIGEDEELWTNTDTAVGHFMTTHNLHSQGSHGATPSGTSRWYSVNLGSMHLVGLDLGQNGQQVGPSNTTGAGGADYWREQQADQIAWLEKDLAAVDRSVTPWILVMSHYPFYHTSLEEHAEMSADWYVSPEAERFVGQFKASDEFRACVNGRSCRTVHEHVGDMRSTLVPILYDYGVDFYSAGHVHDYTANWPLDNTSTVTQRNYVNPKGTIHICEGNGGVPIALGGGHSDHNGHSGYTCGNANAPYNRSCEAPCIADYCRIHRFDPAYGRWTTSNSSVLTYQHVPNDPARFEAGTETWHVTQSSHGPFGPSSPTPSPPPSPPLKSCAAEQGFDWNGTQVCQTNCAVDAKDSAACCAACSERPGCKVGVLVGGQCYLKTAAMAQTKYARAGRTSCVPKYEG